MDDAGKNLIEALRDFIKSEDRPKPEPAKSVSLKDGIWLLVAAACVLLAFSLIPRVWLSNEGAKFLVDKVAPWFLNLGAIAAFLRSPETVLAATRDKRFRWIAGSLLVALLLGTFPAFTIVQGFADASVPFVDGEPGKSGRFSVSFRPHTAELRRSADDPKPLRTFQVGFGDLMGAAIHHGFTLPADWRTLYPVSIDVRDENGLTVCFTPNKFQIDREFVEGDEGVKFDHRSASALEYLFDPDKEASIQVPLPAGSYTVIGFRDGAVTPRLDIVAGPAGDKSYSLRASQVLKTAPASAPCRQ